MHDAAMDRRAWLDERRRAVEEDYSRDATTYEIGNYPITESHRRFVARVVDACPPGGTVLDAACGTGRYFDLVVSAGRRVAGADQSAGMVAQARTRGLATSVEQRGLQELAFEAAFDGVMCIDAMEHVPPEDWDLVLHNLRRALRPDGLLYLTLEVLADQEAALDRAFESATAQGHPVVRGEDVGEDTGGYHFYPHASKVSHALEEAALEVVDEAVEWVEADWGYRHLLLRQRP